MNGDRPRIAAPPPGTPRGAFSAARTTLVLLSFNEREALAQLLPSLPLALFARVIAVDPGSTDGTLDLYAAHAIPVLLQEQRGRGSAFKLAAETVTTPRVVFFSTDGNEDPRDLPRMIACLDEGYDMVIAGRFIRAGAASDNSDDPLRIRKGATLAASALIRLIWRSGVWDAINGFRGFQIAALKRLRLDAAMHDIELQSTIRAARMGMRIMEFATREQVRLGGARKKTAGTWTLLLSLGRSFLRELGRKRERAPS